jgi:hypothetical protein
MSGTMSSPVAPREGSGGVLDEKVVRKKREPVSSVSMLRVFIIGIVCRDSRRF